MEHTLNTNWQLMLKNIGPHENTILSDRLEQLQIGIYANNGVGKTFIGKMFNHIQGASSGNIQEEVIRWGKKEGQFVFKVHEADEIIEQVEASFSKASTKYNQQKKHFLYHVYNQDYVKENLELLGYQPNGAIEGVVLGKERIDLAKEKELLEQIKARGTYLKKQIEETFEARKKSLRKEVSVNPGTTEYKKFNFAEVEKNQLQYDEEASYDALRLEYWQLANLPDEVMDISTLKLDVSDEFLGEVQRILETSYTRSFFEEQFKKEMQQKEQFIEAGMSYIKESECPFCHQQLGEEARHLIHRYAAYLEDEENKVLRQVKKCQDQLREYKEGLREFYDKTYKQCRREYNGIAGYFSENSDLGELNLKITVQSAIEFLNEMLENKKADISLSTVVQGVYIDTIKQHLKELRVYIQEVNQAIKEMNYLKNNNDQVKLSLRKRICKAAFNETLKALATKISDLEECRTKYKALDNQIKAKEYIYRTNKKQLVALTFKQLLKVFFGEKYTFDETSFSLQFATQNLNDKANRILSEGEKEVIAFCYYLATLHTKVRLEDDYEKVFLVIDDPIAHMDERYMEQVCDVLEQLSDLYCLKGRLKYIILSHNKAFLSRLCERDCIEKIYSLYESEMQLGKLEAAASIR